MDVYFRITPQNRYTYAALAPLIPSVQEAREPHSGMNIYSFTTANKTEAYQEASKRPENSILIAGGPHPSARPREALEYFDYVVVGEGEEALPRLIQAIKHNQSPRIPGVAFEDDTKMVFTPPVGHVDLDKYPCFDPQIVFGPMEISRGCPWGCTYCQTPRLFGRRMRHRSIPTIKKYAQYYDDLRFTTPNAFAYGSDGTHPNPQKIEKLLKELSSLDGKRIFFGTFPSEARPDFVTEETISLVSKYCANTTLSLGAQSGSPRILRTMNRGHTLEDVENAVSLCVDAGITPIVDFIFGYPGETPEDQHMSLDLVEWITSNGGRVRAHHFTPLPSTPTANQRPSPISQKTNRVLGELALHGKAEGTWNKTW